LVFETVSVNVWVAVRPLAVSVAVSVTVYVPALLRPSVPAIARRPEK
jgi:hypothetical protein